MSVDGEAVDLWAKLVEDVPTAELDEPVSASDINAETVARVSGSYWGCCSTPAPPDGKIRCGAYTAGDGRQCVLAAGHIPVEPHQFPTADEFAAVLSDLYRDDS